MIHLNQLIATLMQVVMENARLYKQLANYTSTLERKVSERTQALQQEIAERQQTEAALRQSEANYRNLLQTANSVIIRYDPQGLIRYINDYGVKLLGYEEHEIVGRTLFETIIPETELSGRDVRPMIHDLLRNPRSYPQGEGENLCRDGRRVWVAWSNQAIFNEQGELVEILSVGNDTTQRRQAEEALQRSEAKFRTIFENSQVAIYRTRICDGLILNANQRFADLFGFDSPEEMIGLEHTTSYWVNLSDRQQGIEVMKRDGEVRNYEAQMRKRDGTLLWGLFSSYLNAADDYIEGVIADITLQKQAEAASILEERNRMAREIHDTLAQAFTGVLAQVGAAKQVLTDDLEATGAHLDLIKELARTGLVEARRSVVALRPQLLEEGSLQSALHRLVAQTRIAATDTTLYYEIEGAVYALSTEVESNLLRMGQEALTNAMRHANADEIRVELRYDLDRVCLRVKDNGHGFGVGSIPRSEGFGLLGMSERAERIGAQLTIRSQPGQGTEIIITVVKE